MRAGLFVPYEVVIDVMTVEKLVVNGQNGSPGISKNSVNTYIGEGFDKNFCAIEKLYILLGSG